VGSWAVEFCWAGSCDSAPLESAPLAFEVDGDPDDEDVECSVDDEEALSSVCDDVF
jgi:hypothetical protein